MNGSLTCRFAAGLGLDEITMKFMGQGAMDWFAHHPGGRRWFICGAGVHGEPLTAELVMTPNAEPEVVIRPSSPDELLPVQS